MSLAGIAIAIGVLVDAGIVVTENAFRFVEQRGVVASDRQRVWETFGTPLDWSDVPYFSRWRSSCSPSFRYLR